MDMCDILLLSCGVDDSLLDDIFDTIAFIEEDTHGPTNIHTDSVNVDNDNNDDAG